MLDYLLPFCFHSCHFLCVKYTLIECLYNGIRLRQSETVICTREILLLFGPERFVLDHRPSCCDWVRRALPRYVWDVTYYFYLSVSDRLLGCLVLPSLRYNIFSHGSVMYFLTKGVGWLSLSQLVYFCSNLMSSFTF